MNINEHSNMLTDVILTQTLINREGHNCVSVCSCACVWHMNDEFSSVKVTSEEPSISPSVSPITCFSALLSLHTPK